MTPEPGNGTIEAHATIVKKLKSWEIDSNEGIDEIMKTVKGFHEEAEKLMVAGQPGAALAGARVEVVGLPEAKLLGEGADAAEQMRACHQRPRSPRGASRPQGAALRGQEAKATTQSR